MDNQKHWDVVNIGSEDCFVIKEKGIVICSFEYGSEASLSKKKAEKLAYLVADTHNVSIGAPDPFFFTPYAYIQERAIEGYDLKLSKAQAMKINLAAREDTVEHYNSDAIKYHIENFLNTNES